MFQKTLQFFLSVLLPLVKQPWSQKFFRSAKAQFAMTAIEVIIVREVDAKLQVLLTERPSDDPDWPCLLHSPGTMLRNSDVDSTHKYTKAFERILRETGLNRFGHEPVLVDTFPTPTKRGAENSVVFMTTITDEPIFGEFYDVGVAINSPQIVIPEQIFMLKHVKKWYVKISTQLQSVS